MLNIRYMPGAVLYFACIISFNPDNNPVGQVLLLFSFSRLLKYREVMSLAQAHPASQRQCWAHTEARAGHHYTPCPVP